MHILISLLICIVAFLPNDLNAQRIVTFDWTIAETLIALGHPPIGLGQIAHYNKWVGTPKIPANTVDIGLRSQPSMELLDSLQPDLILLSPMFIAMQDKLENIGHTKMLQLYKNTPNSWQQLLDVTLNLGELTQKKEAAKKLITDTDNLLEKVKNNIDDCGPLLIMQFVDSRHVRVYGGSSIYQQVLNHLSIDNSWVDTVNQWGYQVLSIHELAPLKGRAVIIEPIPLGALDKIKNNTIWQKLPINNTHQAVVLPPVWSLGGLPAAQHFAKLLENKVCAQ